VASGGTQAAVRQEPGAGPPKGLATCHRPSLGQVRPVGRRAWEARAAERRPQDANGMSASGLASACPLEPPCKPPRGAPSWCEGPKAATRGQRGGRAARGARRPAAACDGASGPSRPTAHRREPQGTRRQVADRRRVRGVPQDAGAAVGGGASRPKPSGAGNRVSSPRSQTAARNASSGEGRAGFPRLESPARAGDGR
jgi:hypothetical protein